MKKKENYLVYKVVNKTNDKIYIGVTTKSLEERKIDHLQKSHRRVCTYFQQALGTYGFEAFTWEQIDTATDINELAEKETENIIKHNSFHDGYNSNKGGGGFRKSVYQYDIKTGMLINTFGDLTSAANAVNATKKSISNVCLHIDKTCKGYYWSYSSTYEINSNSDLRKKSVYQYALSGDLIATFESVSEASKTTGISKTCISRCCRNERENSGGFIWMYN